MARHSGQGSIILTAGKDVRCAKFIRQVMVMLGVLTLGGCTGLPSIEGRQPSVALNADQAQATLLGRAIRPGVAAHPGLSGLHPLLAPRAAFATRMLLASAAEHTIDVQYYIWQNDITGTMLLAELERAARRGVRVRLLLDDNGIGGLDDLLAALTALPNFQVRLFNPFAYRTLKWTNYITDFSRLNHRMHNKSFTVDNQATIIGGRNIGDIYFAATDDIVFSDLDVMAIGPVVHEVSTEFDDYWASRLAYPINRIVDAPAADTLTHLHVREAQLESDQAAMAYRRALADDRAVRHLFNGTAALTWAPTQMISDSPDKALDQAEGGDRITDALAQVFAHTDDSLDLVSPYLVPTASGTKALAAMARRGVKVRVLTNSLGSADSAAVHAGYLKQRKRLLQAGIELYELSRAPGQATGHNRGGSFGSSGSSLHAKTFAVDGRTLFIGSFNFDQRSANLNTEMGFLIDSPVLAQAMHVAFERDIPRRAYKVYLDGNGEIHWLGWEDGTIRRHNTEPDSSWARRALARFLSWLPIDWLL